MGIKLQLKKPRENTPSIRRLTNVELSKLAIAIDDRQALLDHLVNGIRSKLHEILQPSKKKPNAVRQELYRRNFKIERVPPKWDRKLVFRDKGIPRRKLRTVIDNIDIVSQSKEEIAENIGFFLDDPQYEEVLNQLYAIRRVLNGLK